MLSVIFAAGMVLWPSQSSLHLPEGIEVERGDWIFREGTSRDSHLIQYLSKGRFSHIGMIVEVEPTILIAHATTDDDPNLPNQVLLTPLDDFLSEDKAKSFAVARPRFLDKQQRLNAAVYAYQKIGTPFILDDQDQPNFYCTTLILDAVLTQTKTFSPQWQYLDLAIFRGNYLFPESFTKENIEWIYQSKSDDHIQ